VYSKSPLAPHSCIESRGGGGGGGGRMNEVHQDKETGSAHGRGGR